MDVFRPKPISGNPVEAEHHIADDELRFCRSARGFLTVSPELLVDFIAMFSRAEYALKVTKYRQAGNGEAKADWSAFSEDVTGTFNPKRSELIQSAFSYLIENPPRCLSVQDGAILWVPQVVAPTSDADKILWIIKQVRHNLFHGGKFAYDSNAGSERDTKLLEASCLFR